MTKLPSNIKHVINYLRRSRQDVEREKRTGEDTLSEQKALMDRVMASYDGITYEQKFEIGSGDKIETRPVFKEVIEDLRAGKYDAIAVKEMSRLGRGSYTDMGTIYDLIQENRIHIITPYKVYDPGNPSDLRQIRFELFLSREEFETIRERMLGAKYSYAMSGKWMGAKTPYGYSFDKESQRLVPNDDAAIVKLIFDLYVNGLNGREMGYRSIAVYLRRLGILTPQSHVNWVQVGIKRVLTNSAYIGQVKYRQRQKKDGVVVMRPESEWIVVDDAHEPLVDKETFEEVKLRMKKHKPSVKVDFLPCELAGVVTCSHCGVRMIRHARVRNYKKLDGSVTSKLIEHLYCPRMPSCVTVLYRDVEADILSAIKTISTLDNDALHEYVKSLIPKQTVTMSDEDVIKHLQTNEREIESRIEFIYQQYEHRNYTEEQFNKRREIAEKELTDVRRQLDTTRNVKRNDGTDISVDVEGVRRRIQQMLELYYSLDDKMRKNKLLRGIIGHSEITLIQRGTGGKNKNRYRVEVTPSLDYILGTNV